jgi:hypothetical protein
VPKGESRGWWISKSPLGHWRGGGRLLRKLTDKLTAGMTPDEKIMDFEDRLAKAIRRWGPDGWPVQQTRQALAYLLEEEGRDTEACVLRESVVASLKRHLGNDDPRTLDAETWVVGSLSRLGKLQEAFDLATQILDARVRTVGPDREETKKAKRDVDRLRGWLGQA